MHFLYIFLQYDLLNSLSGLIYFEKLHVIDIRSSLFNCARVYTVEESTECSPSHTQSFEKFWMPCIPTEFLHLCVEGVTGHRVPFGGLTCSCLFHASIVLRTSLRSYGKRWHNAEGFGPQSLLINLLYIYIVYDDNYDDITWLLLTRIFEPHMVFPRLKDHFYSMLRHMIQLLGSSTDVHFPHSFRGQILETPLFRGLRKIWRISTWTCLWLQERRLWHV